MIFVLDTSLRDLHIGLFSDDAKKLAEFHEAALAGSRGIHDALLAQKTFELIQSAHVSLNDISKIAIVIGPGSFTGLRIGLSFAKGLAFGLGAEIVPLKAHPILMQAAKNTVSDFQSTAIAYPGYEGEKLYIAFPDRPEDIRYIEIAEIRQRGIKQIIAPPELQDIGMKRISIPTDLEVIANEAMTSASAKSIAGLEPFYGTDFIVKLKSEPEVRR